MSSALVLILATKQNEFVRTIVEGPTVPTAKLASFLQALVHELGPHVKETPLALKEFLKSGLASLGWSVASNSPAPGSAPPQVLAIRDFLDGALAECTAMPGGFPLYGTALAECVAAELMMGHPMLNSHRDYCGVGLVFDSRKNIFCMSKVSDGYPMSTMDKNKGDSVWTAEEFVPWLARQSDQTLLGDGNQRISRAWLLQRLPFELVELLAESDSPNANMDGRKAAAAAAVARKAVEAVEAAAKRKNQAAEEAVETARRQAEQEVQRKAEQEQKAQQRQAAALATDEAALAKMSKKDVVELIRTAASLESDFLTVNARVMMSPASTKEQVDALFRQVKAGA